MLSIIVAVNKKGVIGLKDTMPWHVPEDLKHFKKTTLNHNLVMGRVTYENLPKKLVDRKMWLVSRTLSGPYVINDFQDFLIKEKDSKELYYIAGGAEIYQQALDYSQEIILSRINNELEGDTFFPLNKLKDFTLSKIVEMDTFTIEYYNRKER